MVSAFQQALNVSQSPFSLKRVAVIRHGTSFLGASSRGLGAKRLSLTPLHARRSFHVAANLSSPLLSSVVTTMGYQATFFLISNRLRTDRLTDLAGASNIAILALLSLAKSAFRSQRHIGVTVAIVTWATRLGTFLFRRITRWGSDRRFDKFRGSTAKLAGFWAIQAVWVCVCALPATLLASAQPGPVLGPRDAIGVALYGIGLALEAVADAQKGSARVKGWPQKGLWRLSRHPNYFGEILVWWGIYTFAAPQLRSAALPAVASPLLVSVLLMFLSGVPILERGADEKYGHVAEYRAYKRTTSVLLPLPPRLYDRLPDRVKRWVLLDLPMYNNIPTAIEGESTPDASSPERET